MKKLYCIISGKYRKFEKQKNIKRVRKNDSPSYYLQ